MQLDHFVAPHSVTEKFKEIKGTPEQLEKYTIHNKDYLRKSVKVLKTHSS